MKVLMLNGSPHAQGNTYTALHEMELIFTAEGIETEIVQIGFRTHQIHQFHSFRQAL